MAVPETLSGEQLIVELFKAPADGHREVLTGPEAIALIRVCSSRVPTGIRNRALIAVLWRCGLRISEAHSSSATSTRRPV